MSGSIRAVVGLGNPGSGYVESRHNVGFKVVEALAFRWRVPRFKHRHAALISRRSGARPVLLALPQTFMNLSGEAVSAISRREDIDPAECLVVVDDVDLPLGELRLRQRGGPGSHNGLRSVVAAIGEGFPRLRLGIRGIEPWADLADYVLAPFEEDEREVVEAMVLRAVECVEQAIYAGLARAANRFNGNVAAAPPPTA